jgi:transposase-like protein
MIAYFSRRTVSHIHELMDDNKCYDIIRQKRWSYGIDCPACCSTKIVKRGKNHRHLGCRRYACHKCGKRFDGLTGTIFAGRHQPLRVWLAYLHLMGLNVSSRQLAQKLGLNESDSQSMAGLLRQGVAKRRQPKHLQGEVEFDEVYIVAGHKGHPPKIKGRKSRRNRLRGARGRGTLAKEKPPVFGMIQRGGEVVIHMLPDVKQASIKPLILGKVDTITETKRADCKINP